MIVFENSGEIDPQLIALIGVNVKQSASAIGFFGTGLKYAVACCSRWGDAMVIQSGTSEFQFCAEQTVIRGQSFGVVSMRSRLDSLRLGFTTELGKQWEPWMVYRELWCNAHDEPEPRVYETETVPAPACGITRVIVAGDRLAEAHKGRTDFILQGRTPLYKIDGLEIYEGAGTRIFYRGIAVQKLDKPSLYTYNITAQVSLTEDRTAGQFTTDPIIARGITQADDAALIDAILTAPATAMECRLDYSYAHTPKPVWTDRAFHAVSTRPLDVPLSVRNRFAAPVPVKTCPTCGRAMDEDDGLPF